MAADLNKAYQWGINTCENPYTRYSMNTSLRYGVTVNGLTYYDCSSFIWFCLKNGDFPLSSVGSTYAFTTRSMDSVLLALGFNKMSSVTPWKAGDILWRAGHTEMVYDATNNAFGEGHTMGAHTNDLPGPEQVSIYTTTGYGSQWTYIYRWGSGGATNYGSNMFVIAAILGNWWVDSKVNPGYWEGGTPGSYSDINKGFGLGQWRNLATAPADGYIPPVKWVYSYYIGSSTGNVIYSAGHKYAMTEIFQVGAGDIIVNNTPTTVDGYRYISEFVFYKTTTTLNDTYMYTRSVTGTATFTVPADCTGMRIQIGRRSADPVILESPDCETNVDVKIRSVNRLNNLYNWLISQNYNPDDGDGQIEFFKNESFWITTGPGAAWANDYPALDDFINSSETDLEKLVKIFMNCWEAIANATAVLTLRYQAAQAVYNWLLDNYNSPSQWTSDPDMITQDEAHHNCVMVFNALSAGIGGGGGEVPDYQILSVPKFLLYSTRKQIVINRR